MSTISCRRQNGCRAICTPGAAVVQWRQIILKIRGQKYICVWLPCERSEFQFQLRVRWGVGRGGGRGVGAVSPERFFLILWCLRASQMNFKAHFLIHSFCKFLNTCVFVFRQFTNGKGKLNDEIHITRTHFGPSHHPQNSMNFPNYRRQTRQFSLTVGPTYW